MSLFMFSYLRPILYNSNIILSILHALFLVVKITAPLETNIPKCRGPGGGGGLKNVISAQKQKLFILCFKKSVDFVQL